MTSTQIFYSMVSVLAVSALSLVGLFTLSFRADTIRRIAFALVALAIGALLGNAFLYMIPEAFVSISNASVPAMLILAGILFMLLFERLLWWHHDHHERDTLSIHDAEGRDVAAEEHARIEPIGRIVLFSDAIHNFMDGIAIAAAYTVSFEVGVATTLAITLHEIPQEIGDFGILLHAGYTRAKALLMNFFSALTAVLGVLVVILLGAAAERFVIYIVPFAAGSLIYIAVADLVPELHRRRNERRFLVEFAMIVLGIALMYSFLFFEF